MSVPASISLTQPLKSVRFGAGPAVDDDEMARRLEACERLAAERGRQEGEKALGEQLLRQQSEMLELQQGALESLRRAIPQVVRETEQALTALALEVARKLISGLPVSAEMVE